MKPANFDYAVPTDIRAALDLINNQDREVKILAGGQSLIPLMNFRLAQPELLVDITRIPQLRLIRRRGGGVRIGATTPQAQVEQSPVVRRHWPLLATAVQHIGHMQIRNAGTIGGSLAHSDPAAELPAAMATLDATMVINSSIGTREVPWHEFFIGPLETCMSPEDLLVEVVLPPVPPHSGSSFREYAKRSGDFALSGAAVRVSLAENGGQCVDAAICLFGVGPTPVRRPEAERMLCRNDIIPELVAHTVEAAMEGIAPTGDIHATGDYRAELAAALLTEAITEAHQRALRARSER